MRFTDWHCTDRACRYWDHFGVGDPVKPDDGLGPIPLPSGGDIEGPGNAGTFRIDSQDVMFDEGAVKVDGGAGIGRTNSVETLSSSGNADDAEGEGEWLQPVCL